MHYPSDCQIFMSTATEELGPLTLLSRSITLVQLDTSSRAICYTGTSCSLSTASSSSQHSVEVYCEHNSSVSTSAIATKHNKIRQNAPEEGM